MGPRWPKMAQDGPRWPEDGPKMEPRWGQDGAKTATKWPKVELSYVAELHTDADCPKSSKLASRVSEVRFLAELGPTFAVRQRYQNSPPLKPPNASRQSRNHKACNKLHTSPLCQRSPAWARWARRGVGPARDPLGSLGPQRRRQDDGDRRRRRHGDEARHALRAVQVSGMNQHTASVAKRSEHAC